MVLRKISVLLNSFGVLTLLSRFCRLPYIWFRKIWMTLLKGFKWKFTKFCSLVGIIFHISAFFRNSVVRRCSVKKMFLKISQNSQENTCARASFSIKLQASGLQLHLKRDSGTVIFLLILRNFQERLFSQTTSSGCFWKLL